MKKDTLTQEQLTCPVCGKSFNKNDDTKYMVYREYTCSWKCFLKEVKNPTRCKT